MKSYLFLADGFEEIEAVATLDVLRRGGVAVESVSIGASKRVQGAHGIAVEADRLLADVLDSAAQCLIFPGGMPGSKNLAECGALMGWLDRHYAQGGFVAAICAAPAWVFVRLPMPLQMTCYPGCEAMLPEAVLSTEGVVVDERVVTAQGPGFAAAFGLKLVELLVTKEQAEVVAGGLLVK